MINKLKNFFNLYFDATVFLMFVVVIFSLYGKSLFFNWTFYDDDVLVLDKQEYFSFSNIKNILTDTVFGQEGDKFCRPVLNLTFLFEKYLYGTVPFGYHLTNVILHLFAVFSIYLLLTLRYNKKKTFLLCLLFAVHPVLVQSVVWVPGRNDSLLTLFVVLSFYFFVRFIDDRKKMFFVFHILLFVLSLLTKETAIIVPFFYFLFLIISDKSDKKLFTLSPFHPFTLKSDKKLFTLSPFHPFTLIIIYLIIILFYFLYRSYVLSYQAQSLNLFMLVKFFIVSLPALTKYVANIFFPVKLSVFTTMVKIDYLLSFVSVFIFIFLLLKFKKYKYDFKIVLFGFLWFLLFLLPTFVMPDNHFYDHRIYLSLFGILISLSEIIKNYNEINFKKAAYTVLIIFLFFYVVSFFHQNKFQNREIFWVNALIDAPESDIANSVVAGLLAEHGLYDSAEERYLKAISLQKNNSKHYVNLSVLYFKMNRIDDAENSLLRALMIDEFNPEIYYNLALVYKIKGDMQKAKYMKSLFIKVFTDTNKVAKVPELKI